MHKSFHTVCSTPLYPLGREKKGRKLRIGLLSLQPAQESRFCLLTHLFLHCRGQSPVQGKIQAQEPRAALSEPPSPEHDGSVIQADGNTKEDWDFTISTQNKWVWQKRNSCLCKQKKSSAAIWEWDNQKCVPALGKEPRLGQRSYSLLGLSNWQARNNHITKSQL